MGEFFFKLSAGKGFLTVIQNSKTSNSQSNLEKEKTELEESGSLTSDYTTKLQ